MKRILLLAIVGFATLLSYATQALFYGPDQLSSSLIVSIYQTEDGLLWVGTANGLNRFDGYRFTQMNFSQDVIAQNPVEVSSLCADRRGVLWVGTARGLFVHDRALDSLFPIAFPDSLEPRITTMSTMPDGRLLVGTAGYGHFYVDADSRTARPRLGVIPLGEEAFVSGRGVEPYLLKMAPADVLLTCSVKDKAGNVYVGTRGNGLYWLPAQETSLSRFEMTVNGIDLNRARIETLYIDRSGNLWVACAQKGLLMIPLQRKPLFETWSFTEQRQETGTYVSAIAAISGHYQSSEDFIWCSVQGDGIYAFSSDGKIVAHTEEPVGIETMYSDAAGNFWLGTIDGLWSYDPQKNKATLSAHLDGQRVNTIKELDEDLLAVSTFGLGFAIVNKTTGQVVKKLSMNDEDTRERGRLANDWIFCFDTDQKGRLWMGTSSGVCCYDPASESFTTEGWRVLVDREQCTALRVLTSGDVLMATEHGLQRWSRKGRLHPENGTEQLRGKMISYIAEDAVGDIWLSTNEGIWRWSPKQRELVTYVGDYSLKEREFVQGAGLQSSDGHIFFGTADGIIRFSPDSIRHRQGVLKQVHLTAFVIGGHKANTQTRSNGKRVMDGPIGDSRKFSLSYVDAAFRLEFSLLDFASAGGVIFEYRLEGERRWQQAPKGENAIAFNHLAPGTYHLEVRGLSEGVYTPVETFIIEVRPPWWRSTIAYILYVLLMIGSTVGLAHIYRRNIQYQLDKEKLHFLMGAINTQDTPLTLDDMKRAINSFVQSRKHQRSLYGNSALMADKLELPAVQGNDEALMERIVQSVNRHLGDSDFSVEQLCEEAAISRAHLHRKMKEMTGLSVTEFIRNIRLEQAARLLREQKLNITQVAYTVGFSNLGYFSTIFRKHFGVSPRSYVEAN